MTAQHKTSNTLLVVAFLAILALPTLGMVTGVGTSKAPWFEARTPFPERPHSAMALLQLPNQLRNYANVHFAFRVPLMELYAQLKVRIFGVSGSDSVMLGKDGWLFFTGDKIVDDYRCVEPFTDAELARWKEHLTTRRDWLRSRGIAYVFAFAPNTGTIYPEYLPDTLHRFGSTSRLEQVTDYLALHSDFQLVELRPALNQAKSRGQLYYKTDSHWNQMGGFVAAEQIGARIRGLFPVWKTATLDNFDRVLTPDWGGDLGYMLGAPSLFRETRVDLVPKGGTDVRSDGAPLPRSESEGNWAIRPVVVRESATGEIPRAIVLRDSYFGGPAQFLSSHFGRMVMLWSHDMDPKIIDEEKPNIVIEVFVERTLMHPLLDDIPLPPSRQP